MERTTKHDNEKYCFNCGQVIDIKAEICPKCGVRQFRSSPLGFDSSPSDDPNASSDDWLVTLLLCFFLGVFGIHRFYTNNILLGVLQLITLGGCGIWVIIDLILLVTNKFQDGDGRVVRYR